MSIEPHRAMYGCATGNHNDITNQIDLCTFSVLQYKVLNAILRRSYGNAGHQLASGTGDGRMAILPNHHGLAEYIGMTPQGFSKICKELMQLGVLIRESQTIGVNTNFHEWRMDLLANTVVHTKHTRVGAGRPSAKVIHWNNSEQQKNHRNNTESALETPVETTKVIPVNNSPNREINHRNNNIAPKKNHRNNFDIITGISPNSPQVALGQDASPALIKRRKVTEEYDEDTGNLSDTLARSSPSVPIPLDDETQAITDIQAITQMLPQNIALLLKQFHPRLSYAHIVTALAACAEFHRAKHPDAPIMLKQAQGWLEREVHAPSSPNRPPNAPQPLPASAVTAVIPPTSKKYRQELPPPSTKGITNYVRITHAA